MSAESRVTDGIDREWLERAFRKDPVMHSFAAWDLDHEPERVRILSLKRDGSTLAYLLVWLGDPARPFVHWVGPVGPASALADHLPPRPLVVVGSPELVEVVTERRGPFTVIPLLRLTARPTGPVVQSDDPRVRRVLADDAERLRAWAANHPDPMVKGYARFDPNQHVVWAAFHGERIVGAAVASVRLPEIWTFNGIYVEPFARGEKLGTALTAHGLEAARRAGALAHLNVREENAPARRVYERLGYVEHDRVVLLEPPPERPP